VEGAIVQIAGEDVTYRASSLGSCIRALAAGRQELEAYQGPLPKTIQETFDKGDRAEEQAFEWARDKAWVVVGQQQEVVLPLTKRLRVVGHVDGLYSTQNMPGTGVVEVKRQNDDEWAKDRIEDSWLWDKYCWQFSAYMLALETGLVCLRVNDKGDVKPQWFPEPPKSKADILGRVLEVERVARLDLKTVECDRDDFPCPYFQLFHPRTEEVWEEREDTKLADLALHYVRLGGEIEPLDKRRKELRGEILGIVGDQGRVREMVSGITVRVTTSDVKERVIPAGKSTRVTVRLPDDVP
jgi:hypothetical protein